MRELSRIFKVTYNEAAEILGTSKHNELKAKLSEIKWMMSYTFHAPSVSLSGAICIMSIPARFADLIWFIAEIHGMR